MSDPRTIAEGLTWDEAQELRAQFYATPIAQKLKALGLLKDTPSSWLTGPVYLSLTPLGLAVRRVLEGG